MKCGGERYAGKRILTARLYLRARRMAVRARDSRHAKSAARHEERAIAAEDQAKLIRRALRLDG